VGNGSTSAGGSKLGEVPGRLGALPWASWEDTGTGSERAIALASTPVVQPSKQPTVTLAIVLQGVSRVGGQGKAAGDRAGKD